MLILASLLCDVSLASLLLRDAHNPCVAYGNATVFNITSLFEWPATALGTDFEQKQYQYSWACAGLPIATTASKRGNQSSSAVCAGDVAVCQHDRPLALDFNAGAVSTKSERVEARIRCGVVCLPCTAKESGGR